MNDFYKQPKILVWIESILFLLVGLLLAILIIETGYSHPVIYTAFILYIPISQFLFTPFFTGLFFSKDALSGLLAGIIVSGVQIAFSFSNTGGAWDNTKKLVAEGIHESTTIMFESEEHTPFIFKKKNLQGISTEEHNAAVVGDTVGDPLKDTSGPSINILMKLSAITSLIFASFIAKHGGLIIKAAE